MSKYALSRILEHLRQELTLTEVKAREIGSRFEVLRRETESVKVDALQNYLEEQKNSAARDRGIASLIKDRRRVRVTWKENISRTRGNDFSTGYPDNFG